MQKTIKGILAAIILGVLIVVVTKVLSTNNTTFKEDIVDPLNLNELTITSIEIIKSSGAVQDDEVTVTDSSEIRRIMEMFSQAKLHKSKLSNIEFTDAYWITLHTNEGRLLGMTLYDQNYLQTYNYSAGVTEKSTISSYKITNEINPSALHTFF